MPAAATRVATRRLCFYIYSACGLPAAPPPSWSTWSAQSFSLTSRAGELRSAPSEPDDRDRVLHRTGARSYHGSYALHGRLAPWGPLRFLSKTVIGLVNIVRPVRQ